MYIIDDVAYADDSRPVLRVCGVRPLPNHRLWVRFNDGNAKEEDFTPILNDPAFIPLHHTGNGMWYPTDSYCHS